MANAETKESNSRLIGSFRILCRIGAGTYGTVYRAQHVDTNEFKALKKVKWENANNITFYILREIVILRQLKHVNIVNLESIIMMKFKMYLVFENMDRDLWQYLSFEYHNLCHNRVRDMLRQILEGMLYCHIHKVVHRDMKPQNILTNNEGTILKIADFGLARFYPVPSRDLTPKITSVWYRPPSIILGCTKYGTAVDVWAIGCIFSELSICQPLFNGDSEIGVLFKIFSTLRTPEPNQPLTSYKKWQDSFPKWHDDTLNEVIKGRICPEGIELLRKMLIYEDCNRINCREALNHEYFSNELVLSTEKFGLSIS